MVSTSVTTANLSKHSRMTISGLRRTTVKRGDTSLRMLIFVAALTMFCLDYSSKRFADAFQIHNLNRHCRPSRGRQECYGTKNDSDDSSGTKEDMDIITKSSWYAVEWFGNAFGKNEKSEDTSDAVMSQPKSLEETVQRINDDNDRYYFLSGEIDSYIYDEDCVFADPFVSFSGRDRFVQNLQNLGSFITRYDARVVNYSPVTYEDSIPIIQTKIMVKLELNLPWKPVLAWPWGVKYEINPDTFLITKHEESWNIEPLEGVKMIFRPAPAAF